MNLKRLIAGTVIAGSLTAAGLGLGAGLANAEPWHGPGPGWVQRPDIRWQDRDAYNRAVWDHRPFLYDNQWVNPVFDPGYRAWGFWLGPVWIPLL